MTGPTATVAVVEDDPSVRGALRRLLGSAGYEVETFATAAEFRARSEPARAGCLVLDVRMPGESGLELQEALAAGGCDLPIVFITGHGDIPMAVKALKAGAVDFLVKPFDERDLLRSVQEALRRVRRAGLPLLPEQRGEEAQDGDADLEPTGGAPLAQASPQ